MFFQQIERPTVYTKPLANVQWIFWRTWMICSLAHSVIRATLDWFRTTCTLVDNAHPHRVTKTTRISPSAIMRNYCSHFMQNFTEIFWLSSFPKLNFCINKGRKTTQRVSRSVNVSNRNFHKRILFNGKAHFCLNGCVNKEYCHIWSDDNPKAEGIIGSYSTIKSVINNYFVPLSDNFDVEDLCFQPDYATCRTTNERIYFLKKSFGEWTSLDKILRNYLNSLGYTDKPEALNAIEEKIRHLIADIKPQLQQKMIEMSSSLPEIFFKI